MDIKIEKIKEVAASVFECEVNNDTAQNNCDKWDSMHHLNLVVELEMEFDVNFDPEEIAQMTSIKEIEAVLLEK